MIEDHAILMQHFFKLVALNLTLETCIHMFLLFVQFQRHICIVQ